MSILSADKSLRYGYTTGACAAAGVMACLLYEAGKAWQMAEFPALDGTLLQIPVAAVKYEQDGALTAEVVKFSGDDPDITNGVSVFTTVRHTPEQNRICFLAGEGVGKATKPGLSVPVGEPAINPGPRELIKNVVEDMTGTASGLTVTISIPAGTELAKQTLNPVLGIEGGISVIGTTGVLRPMSEEAFKDSLVPQIEVAKASGFEDLVFVPGKIGERAAVSWGLPQAALVQTSNFVGFMLENAARLQVQRILLFGHIGKMAKVAAGVFYTHNRIGDARLETIAAYAAASGLGQHGTERILAANTTEDALAILAGAGTDFQRQVCDRIAARASVRAERYLFGKSKVGTVMVTMKGELLGMDERAKEIGEGLGWQPPEA